MQDIAVVWQRVRNAAIVYDSTEGRALSPSRNRSSSPVKEGSLMDSQAKKSKATDHAAVSFHVVVEVKRSTTCLVFVFALMSLV